MLSFTKYIQSTIESGKRVVQIVRFGKSDVQTANEVSPFGFDGQPLEDFRAIYAATTKKGQKVILGYINKNQLAGPGESRMFSIDSDGNVVMSLHFKSNGTAEFNGGSDNMVRFNELETAYNELKGKLNSHITNWNLFAAAYIPGSPSTIGLPPTAATSSQSSGDIAPAKIEEIKTSSS